MLIYVKYNTKHYVNIWFYPNPALKRTNIKLNIIAANNKNFKYSKPHRTSPSCFNTHEKWNCTIWIPKSTWSCGCNSFYFMIIYCKNFWRGLNNPPLFTRIYHFQIRLTHMPSNFQGLNGHPVNPGRPHRHRNWLSSGKDRTNCMNYIWKCECKMGTQEWNDSLIKNVVTSLIKVSAQLSEH